MSDFSCVLSNNFNFLLQLVLLPRIEVTSIFSGSTPADYRRRDFDQYRCNDSYYDIAGRETDKRCEELFQMAGTLVFDGAARKSPVDSRLIFFFLSYRDDNEKFYSPKKNLSRHNQ